MKPFFAHLNIYYSVFKPQYTAIYLRMFFNFFKKSKDQGMEAKCRCRNAEKTGQNQYHADREGKTHKSTPPI